MILGQASITSALAEEDAMSATSSTALQSSITPETIPPFGSRR
jgi:hypothetical protein